MKIGIDLDECVVDFVNRFLKIYNLKFNTNFLFENWHSYNFWEVVGGTKEDSIKLANEFYNSSEFDNICLIDGAKEAIHKLSKKHRLFIVTSRPIHIKDKTNNFIEKHFPNIFSEIIYTGDLFNEQGSTKAEICKKRGINMLIEDNANYAISCANQGVKIMLFDKPWNKNAENHDNIKRVSNWREILEEVERRQHAKIF